LTALRFSCHRLIRETLQMGCEPLALSMFVLGLGAGFVVAYVPMALKLDRLRNRVRHLQSAVSKACPSSGNDGAICRDHVREV
jgi:hypothetical protein